MLSVPFQAMKFSALNIDCRRRLESIHQVSRSKAWDNKRSFPGEAASLKNCRRIGHSLPQPERANHQRAIDISRLLYSDPFDLIHQTREIRQIAEILLNRQRSAT